VRNGGEALRIVLLHDQATLFTRTANFFENRIFDNEEAWQALSEKDRQTFVQRLNRGVVWESVTEILADAAQLALEPGRAAAIEHGEHRPGARQPDLVVRFSNHLMGETSHTADIVVDAAGFDPWWFRELVSAPLRAELPKRLRPERSEAERDAAKERAAELERTMAADLSLALPDWPKLHVPMLSQAVGPGYMSLMALGGMADRILDPYFKALTQEDQTA
jgi:mycobactin lysine-N-oxygenase